MKPVSSLFSVWTQVRTGKKRKLDENPDVKTGMDPGASSHHEEREKEYAVPAAPSSRRDTSASRDSVSSSTKEKEHREHKEGKDKGDDAHKLKLISVAGGDSMRFEWKGAMNVEIGHDVLEAIRVVHTYIPEVAKVIDSHCQLDEVDPRNYEQLKALVDKYNKAAKAVQSLWKGATRPGGEWWSQERANTILLKNICQTAFNRAVPDVKALNKHYEAFSSEVYGETSFEQLQLIIDHIQPKEKDVFVDLGSGVGQLVVYMAGGSRVKRAVGIEISKVPSDFAKTMDNEFRKWMRWYGKKYRQFTLEQGDFLDQKYRDLITKEASIVFINNYAFTADLQTRIKRELLAEMKDGTRIISTREFASPSNKPITERQLNDIAGILDVERLPTVTRPTSWTDKQVPYFCHTVNRVKLEQYFLQRSLARSASHSENNSRRSSVSSKNSSARCSSRESADSKTEAPVAGASVEVGGGGAVGGGEASGAGGAAGAAATWKDDEEVYGPTTRRKWNDYVKEIGKKKEPKSEEPKWNEPDSEYVPPEKKTKKERAPKEEKDKADKTATATARSVVRGRPRKSSAASTASLTTTPKSSTARRAQVSEEVRETLGLMHDSIVEMRPAAVDPRDGVQLVPLQSPTAVAQAHMAHAPSLAHQTEQQPPLQQPLQPQPQLAVVPPGAVVLDPTNPLDQYLIEARASLASFVDVMKTEQFRQSVMQQIAAQTAKNAELSERNRAMETNLNQLRTTGVLYLRQRLEEVGMSDVETPGELLNSAKEIVANHNRVTKSCAHLEVEVAALEARIRHTAPFGDNILDRLDSMEVGACSESGDPYGAIIAAAQQERNQQLGVDESHVVPSSASDLMSPTTTTAAPARRARQRPRANPAKRGAAGAKQEENSEEMERQIQEIVQKALLVDNQAKEKERRARGQEGGGGGGGGKKRSSAGAHSQAASVSMASTAEAMPAMSRSSGFESLLAAATGGLNTTSSIPSSMAMTLTTFAPTVPTGVVAQQMAMQQQQQQQHHQQQQQQQQQHL